jgi:hypothetical protein
MNVLFVLYGEMTCNSAGHVDGLARALSDLGVECAAAVPLGNVGVNNPPLRPYAVKTFAEVLARPCFFSDGRGPDVVHYWNPREINRKFHLELTGVCSFQAVIHLEDNEEHIARTILGAKTFAKAERGVSQPDYPASLSHPKRMRQFMAQANGFSLLIDSLRDMVPADAPRVVFWPAADAELFGPRPRNDAMRRQLGIAPDVCVLTYTGNTHGANWNEVRSLYLAAALLNRQGVPTRLVRTGCNNLPQPPEYQEWVKEFSIELGYVDGKQRVADVMAMADIYVQPGKSDPFNDYRFPSKVPEFFAMGKPVVLPRANLGKVTRHLVDAYVLEEADGANICEAVARLWSDHDLRQRLSAGALEFAAANFSWKRSAGALASFYDRLACSTEAGLPGQPALQAA